MAEIKKVGGACSHESALSVLIELLDHEICKPTENLTIQAEGRGKKRFYCVVALSPYPHETAPYTKEVRYWQSIIGQKAARIAARKAADD